MLKADVLTRVSQIYREGGNVSQFLRNKSHDATDAIMISYEFQAGSYVAAYNKDPEKKIKYAQQVIDEIGLLGSFNSILEAGVGEATTFKNIIQSEKNGFEKYYGFDISWSRLRVAKNFLNDIASSPQFFVAELSNIPLCDNAIDIVYTSHSIEPNRGHEKEILEELYRITKNYLLLFEPDYRLASEEGKARMDEHGYIKDLEKTISELGYDVIKKKHLEYVSNPLNPTSVTVIKKSDVQSRMENNIFQCPISKTSLLDCGEIYFAPDPHLMYPVIQDIPCLLDSQAILGCQYEVDK